jgi:cell wall-associated NlpC family hydrolase
MSRVGKRRYHRSNTCGWGLLLLLTTQPISTHATERLPRAPGPLAISSLSGSSFDSPDLNLPKRPDEGVSRGPISATTARGWDLEDTPVREGRIAEIESSLYEAILERIGLPYRLGGTDDLGYDCSGFIWRVFQLAGIDFRRASVREMWELLPEVEEGDEGAFGVIVFFSGLTHAGIVRDAHSFYHASSSQGIVRSFYSDYWGARITGYRRVPLPQPPRTRPRWSRPRASLEHHQKPILPHRAHRSRLSTVGMSRTPPRVNAAALSDPMIGPETPALVPFDLVAPRQR